MVRSLNINWPDNILHNSCQPERFHRTNVTGYPICGFGFVSHIESNVSIHHQQSMVSSSISKSRSIPSTDNLG